MGREKNGGGISSLVVYFRKMRWPSGKDKDSELNHMENKNFHIEVWEKSVSLAWWTSLLQKMGF